MCDTILWRYFNFRVIQANIQVLKFYTTAVTVVPVNTADMNCFKVSVTQKPLFLHLMPSFIVYMYYTIIMGYAVIENALKQNHSTRVKNNLETLF